MGSRCGHSVGFTCSPAERPWHVLSDLGPRSVGLRILALIFAMVTMWIFIRSFGSFNVKTVRLPRWLGEWGSLLGAGPVHQSQG